MSRYAVINLNKRNYKLVMKLCSTVAETFEAFAFMVIGVSVFGFSYPVKEIGFLGFFMNFLFLLVSRFFNIIIVSFIVNRCMIKRINIGFKAIMWLSGLRGAMAFAIAISNTNNPFGYEFLSMIIVFSIITIYVFGGIMPFAIRFFKVEQLNEGFDIARRDGWCSRKFKQFENWVYKYFSKNQMLRRSLS